MCGIAGFCNTTWDNKKVILQMNEQMINRGPDAGGYFMDESNGMTLGHRRLAIVGLGETGAQPMLSHNERFVILYNGEIYNANQLREKLLSDKKVTSFRGTSDTEILLEAIVTYGLKEALTKAKGMFAIALYDRQEKTLTLVRDRVGEKPLYYGHVNGSFVFASDLACIKVVPGFWGKISMEAVQKYLRYGYVGAPLSIYEGIYKVMPGHIVTIHMPYDTWQDTVYYDLKEEYKYGKRHPFTGSFSEAVDGLEGVLKAAVKSQMMADVPLGAFLSGGIDSSAIVSLMQSQSNEKIKTFTIGFEEEKYNEEKEATAIAKHLGTEHTSLVITEKELQDVVYKIPEIFSEPFADSSQIPTYLVSKLAREKVIVSLSGDAGDELFCGYNTYWKTKELYDKVKYIPNFLKTPVGKTVLATGLNHNNTCYRGAHCLMAKDIANLHESVCYDTTDLTKALLDKEKLAKTWKQPLLLQDELIQGLAKPEDEMMLRDLLSYHPDDILVKVDRAGMAVSLENRVPMLDKDVLAYAFSLPVEYKTKKAVLKEVLYRYVPKELMDRPKKGFSVPLTRWLQEGKIHEHAKELLTNSRLVLDGILDEQTVKKLWSDFLLKGTNKGLLWNVIVLEQWYRHERK